MYFMPIVFTELYWILYIKHLKWTTSQLFLPFPATLSFLTSVLISSVMAELRDPSGARVCFIVCNSIGEIRISYEFTCINFKLNKNFINNKIKVSLYDVIMTSVRYAIFGSKWSYSLWIKFTACTLLYGTLLKNFPNPQNVW